MAKQLPVGNTKFVLVDDDVYEWAQHFTWNFGGSKNRYAKRWRGKSDPPGPQSIYLHREIAGAQPGQVVDHVSGDPSDNRRCNLRICSPAGNSRNRGLGRNSTSGVVGVCWDRNEERWKAHIRVGKRRITLGYFRSLENARQARIKGERKYFGEFSPAMSRGEEDDGTTKEAAD